MILNALIPGRRGPALKPLLAALLLGVVLLAPGGSPVAAFNGDLGLISAEALNRRELPWVILDGRPQAEWEKGRIPGSHSFSWEVHTRTDEKGVPHQVLPPEEMARTFGRLGIDENTPVAAYGDADTSRGGEGWICWVLSRIGHKGPIRLLDGGIQAWRTGGLQTASGPETASVPEKVYKTALRAELDISTRHLERDAALLSVIDVQTGMEWLVRHVPLAVRVPWQEFTTEAERRVLSPEALREHLRKRGVDLNKPVVYYGSGDARSAFAWTVHQIAGLPAARNYSGGMEAWKRRSYK